MNFMLKSTVLLICLVNLINCLEEVAVVFKYKSNATLDCSNHSNVEYYQKKNEKEPVKLVSTDDKHVQIVENVLVLNDLRGEQIKAEYFCKSGEQTVKKFKIQIAPFILKPEKPSQTVTEGGKVELKCGVLYGNEDNTNKWVWKKNDTELTVQPEKYLIESNTNGTILTLINSNHEDKGDYECELTNSYGLHSEKIQVRVKDPLAALWPFLAIVAEVIVLCLIILIYEKKCSKKPLSNEEDNEQSQNLMGNQANSDLKKRNTKA